MNQEIDYAMTREEVAAKLGISRSRVGQIEVHALKKLGLRMAGYVKPREPLIQDSWERKYDKLYREAMH